MAKKAQEDEDERQSRLDSFASKNYGEDICFPVELVDRDGVVRRYTYEESLAVYHRRIQSAPWRFRDEHLVKAEVDHCSRRIVQIKESYSRLQSEGRTAPSTNPRAALGPGFDVLMSYYRGLLERRDLKLRSDFMPQVQLLEDRAACRTYHVGFGRGGGGHLFYVYPYGQAEGAGGREEFENAKRGYERTVAGVDVERMLVAESTPRAGYILTGRDELPAGLRDYCQVEQAGTTLAEFPSLSLAESKVPERGDARLIPSSAAGQREYEEGLRAVREERLGDAVDSFLASIEANAYHREAYLLLLAVLDSSGRYEEARFYGDLAERNLPGDGLLAYRRGIAAVRQGAFDEALACFDEASELSPSLYQPHFFAAHLLLARGAHLDEVERRLERADRAAPGQPEVLDSLAALGRSRKVGRLVRLGAGLSLLALGGLALGLPAAGISVGALGLGAGVLLGGFAAGLVTMSSRISTELARPMARRCFREPA